MRSFDSYIADIKNDAETFASENRGYFSDLEAALDEMELQITGNDNGSYFGNAYRAEQAIGGALWDERFTSWLACFGISGRRLLDKGPEYMDVLIRLAAFSWCRGALEDIAVTAVYDENEPTEYYGAADYAVQHVIIPFLGDFANDYDIDGIASEVLDVDVTGTGVRVYVRDITPEILEKYDLTAGD